MARVEIWVLINIHKPFAKKEKKITQTKQSKKKIKIKKKSSKQTKISDEIVDTSHNDHDLFICSKYYIPIALILQHLSPIE